MMHLSRIVLVFILSISIFTADAFSGSLREDYRGFELKRLELEKQRRRYEARLRTLSSRRQSLNLALYQCVSQKWGGDWESKLGEEKKRREQLEIQRLNLVKLRKELDGIRTDFEKKRVAIEKKYYKKARGEDYETEVREYMASMNQLFFKRVETELFKGYEEYLAGVEGYLEYLRITLAECAKSGKTSASSP